MITRIPNSNKAPEYLTITGVTIKLLLDKALIVLTQNMQYSTKNGPFPILVKSSPNPANSKICKINRQRINSYTIRKIRNTAKILNKTFEDNNYYKE